MIKALKKIVRENWRLTQLYMSLLGKRRLLLNRKTELLIEGYPRSANTFAVTYFCSANPNLAQKIAHHIHYPSHVNEAVRRGVPVILLIREPIASIASLCVRENYTAQEAIWMYTNFYNSASRVAHKVCIANFDDTITNFSRIIAKTNTLYGTSFITSSLQSNSQILSQVEQWNIVDSGGDVRKSSAPSELRKAKKRAVIDEILSPTHKNALTEATQAYMSIARHVITS